MSATAITRVPNRFFNYLLGGGAFLAQEVAEIASYLAEEDLEKVEFLPGVSLGNVRP